MCWKFDVMVVEEQNVMKLVLTYLKRFSGCVCPKLQCVSGGGADSGE